MLLEVGINTSLSTWYLKSCISLSKNYPQYSENYVRYCVVWKQMCSLVLNLYVLPNFSLSHIPNPGFWHSTKNPFLRLGSLTNQPWDKDSSASSLYFGRDLQKTLIGEWESQTGERRRQRAHHQSSPSCGQLELNPAAKLGVNEEERPPWLTSTSWVRVLEYIYASTAVIFT